MKEKCPNCVYAQPQYIWHHSESSGYIEHAGRKEYTDLRGYWGQMGIQCTAVVSEEDRFPIFWCKNPSKCKRREEGEPKPPAYTWHGSVV